MNLMNEFLKLKKSFNFTGRIGMNILEELHHIKELKESANQKLTDIHLELQQQFPEFVFLPIQKELKDLFPQFYTSFRCTSKSFKVSFFTKEDLDEKSLCLSFQIKENSNPKHSISSRASAVPRENDLDYLILLGKLAQYLKDNSDYLSKRLTEFSDVFIKKEMNLYSQIHDLKAQDSKLKERVHHLLIEMITSERKCDYSIIEGRKNFQIYSENETHYFLNQKMDDKISKAHLKDACFRLSRRLPEVAIGYVQPYLYKKELKEKLETLS